LPGLLAPGPFEARGQCALPSVRPFTPSCCLALLRPLLTSRSALQRRPFGREARPPQVRAVAFPAPSPDLRRAPLVARASRSLARSPWDVTPPIRFLFVDARLRSPLLSVPASRPVTLRFARGPCDPVPQRTCTSWSRSCWAHQRKRGGSLPLPPPISPETPGGSPGTAIICRSCGRSVLCTCLSSSRCWSCRSFRPESTGRPESWSSSSRRSR